MPLAPGTIRGLINLRGQIVTAIDLRHRLELPPRAADQLPMNVVVRSEDGAVSLWWMKSATSWRSKKIPTNVLPRRSKGWPGTLIQGVYKLKDRLLLILDTEKTVSLTITGIGLRRTEPEPIAAGALSRAES